MKRRRNQLTKKAQRGFRGYPLATIALYGPNDKLATKVAVGIVLREGEEPTFLERWFTEKKDIRTDEDVNAQILEFVKKHNVRTVVAAERVIGCPHEEGADYPEGQKCPECEFWATRDRWTGKTIQ